MKSNLQIGIEKQRAVYAQLRKPLLLQIASLYQLSYRDIAEIFGISRSHAENILLHRKMPSLELAIRLARYFEVSTDELFGWQFDDEGIRRPLLIELPGTRTYVKLRASNKETASMEMVRQVAELLGKKVAKVKGRDDGNWRTPESEDK